MVETENGLTRERSDIAASLQELESQRRWYSSKAGGFKKKSQWMSLLIILCGGLTALLPVFKPSPPSHWTEYAVAVLGLLVVITQGMQRIWGWDRIWPQYRLASELMKREQRLYIHNAGGYAGISSETEARRRYIENLEMIVAEEQKIFWRDRQDSQAKSGPPASS